MKETLATLQGRRVALLGMGVEHRALARVLARAQVPFVVCARSPVADQAALTNDCHPWLREWCVGPGYLDDLSPFDLLFRTPGVNPDLPRLRAARARGIQVSSQTRLFADMWSEPWIGVTGTKGKGTTATLLAAMLDAAGGGRVYLGGNIGQPPVAWLHELRRGDRVVLELSSFQLVDWDRSPHGAVVLNVTRDHLDYHGSVSRYIAAKRRICRTQGPRDWLVVDDDNPVSAAMAHASGATVLRFSIDHEVAMGAWVDDGHIQVRIPGGDRETVCALTEIRLRGRHNWANVAAAAAAARMAGAPVAALRRAIRAFAGLPHRLQLVAVRRGVSFYDDSLATTPGAAAVSLAAFREPVVLIAGGSSKGADFAELAAAVRRLCVRGVVLIGEEGPAIAAALRHGGGSSGALVKEAGGMEQAVEIAFASARPGDVVLLAPACASFDMFADYRERGQRFAAAALAVPVAPA